MKRILIIPLLLSSLLLTGCSSYSEGKSQNMGYMHCGSEKFSVSYECNKRSAKWCSSYEYEVKCFEYTKTYTGQYK